MDKETLTLRQIFFFWVPLALTWLMMAAEGPFLAAIIARLPDPKYNLAAFGVAFSLAVLVESPILMIMAAATALVKDRDSLVKMKNFTYALNGLVTLVMVLLIVPPVFDFVTETLLRLPERVSNLIYPACVVLIPWPAAIGYRRFYQGVLIRSNLTRRVAYGTVVRLSVMALTGLVCFLFTRVDGALVGGLSLSLGVCAEAVASKVMVRRSERAILAGSPGVGPVMSYRVIARFYFPLALTTMVSVGIIPVVTFFLSHSRMPVESLAVFPVVNSLVFLFRSMGISFQEVGIALLGENNRGYKPLRDFAFLLGLLVTGALGLVAFTPLSSLWFQQVSGLGRDLYELALLPTQIMVIMPGLMVLLSFQRSILVKARRTEPITFASIIEVGGTIVVLFFTIKYMSMVGVIGAALSLLIGRVCANAYLFIPYFQELKKGNVP
jgi:progressive ankylosis protein